VKTHKEIFSEIYAKNIWGGSGGGSTPENTVEYRKLLQKLLKDLGIRSVVDYGCGDWSFSRLIDWSGVWYVGIDVVESVIESNRKKYGKPTINFHYPTYRNRADMMILKDVLQHWGNSDIVTFLANNKDRYKYILIVNSSYQASDDEDIEAGQSRGLSAKFYPLSQFGPEIIAEIKTTIVSEVSLIKNI
jgi:predicted TPR repeat methyltransferase